MTRRALVIGSQIEGLEGVDHDSERVRDALAARGFAVDLRLGRDASRAGILDGQAALARDAAADDAVVIYYAGHGAYVVNADPRAGRPEHTDVPRLLQFIAPTDFRQSTDGDFRGISAWELSLRLAELTQVTRNVTVVFDCCHAAQMSRDAAARGARPRALPHPQRLGIDRYLAALRDQGARFDRLAPDGNPDAVRVFACGEMQSAWEHGNASGERMGVLTESWLGFLDEIGDAAVTWESLGRAIRERVLRLFPDQRPEIAGPLGREPFSLREPARSRAVPILAREDHAVVRAGAIAGVCEGDVYGVMPLDAACDEAGARIATAVVTRVGALEAEVALADWRDGHRALPDGALAFPLRQQLSRHPVRIEGEGEVASRLRAAVEGAPRLRAAAADERSAILAIARADAAAIAIADTVGDLFPPVAAAGADAVAQVVELLGDLAVAASIRDLEGAHGLDAASALVTWGVVTGGSAQPQPAHGALLGLGDSIYLRVDNRSRRSVRVHVFNIGVRGKVTRLTGFAPSGVRVEGGDSYTLGAVDGHGLVGLRLAWPSGLPRALPRPDELIVIATPHPVDLGLLETEQRIGRELQGRAATGLQALLIQLHCGGSRDVAGGIGDGFIAVRRSFSLHPIEARLAGPGFLIDDNPLATRGAVPAEAWQLPARNGEAAEARGRSIAIRVGELIAHADRALGSADLRVDALVTTRGAPYAAQTLRCSGSRDGDRLLDRALLFEGDVHDFVDLCVWVSRDGDQRTLAELLAERASWPELRQAEALLAADGSWVGAVAGSAVLARMAGELLAGVSGRSLGLYRTSFVASDGFGIGRHPPSGLCQTQDFSFAIGIAPAGSEPT